MKKGILIIAIMLVGLIRVNAASVVGDGVGNGYFYFESSDSFLTSELSSYTWSQYSNDDLQRKRVTFNNFIPSASSDYVEFNVLWSQPLTITSTHTEVFSNCWRFMPVQCGEDASGNYSCGYQCYQWSTGNGELDLTLNDIYTNEFTDMQVLPIITYHEGGWASCSMNGNTITCPTNNKNIDFIDFDILFKTSKTTTLKVSLSRTVTFYKSSSTAIIENQNQNTQSILDQNTTYQDTPSEDINGTTIDNYEQAEQNLLNSLDMNMTLLDGITINPNASAFIWNTADRLRNINPGIILLITSILGMGIIKMVLNR